ncbi:HPr(Ser) kinase/phosphatase [Sandaracinus amylolyticus]|uniref:HPr(Ser) kinase/phosphatase n=1 Tax=Sandaracinus amylolyticus TaxID=927083 RepID=UPI001F0012AC|nr:HPr(Ser) kinase/phosphatase [Sandaracinus amylolyticus]UJR81367.1 HPr kinase/phosphorylase [Sandaracinus amylolyticus]
MPERESVPPATLLPTRALVADPELAALVDVITGERGLDRTIDHPRIQKSGLALAGHLVGVVASRVQILGETEISYLETLAPALRVERLRGFFGLGLACVVVTRGVAPPPELEAVARETDVPLLVATPRSSTTIAALHGALDRLLAPRESTHGVMIEVHGLGLLLVGPSGIGKSESALVMIERGARLVADDRVDLVRMGDRVLGTAPALLRHHLEIRGLGILNIRDLFGATAVQDEANLDVIIELCHLHDERSDEGFDRLGLDDATRSVLGVPVPILRVPVYPGRDMGVLLEVATRNQLLKRAGHHSAREFAQQLARGLGVPSR